jgi:hypothetical protein
MAQTVVLTETGINTGVFTASVETSELGGNGVFAAPPGSTVTVQYTDLAPTPTRQLNATRKVAIGGDLAAIVPVPTPATNPCIIIPGQLCNTFTFSSFSVTVVDADMPAGLTPLVTAFNTRGVESEVITMRANGVGSITYTGTLSVQASSVEGNSGDGILNLAQGDRVQVRVCLCVCVCVCVHACVITTA